MLLRHGRPRPNDSTHDWPRGQSESLAKSITDIPVAAIPFLEMAGASAGRDVGLTQIEPVAEPEGLADNACRESVLAGIHAPILANSGS